MGGEKVVIRMIAAVLTGSPPRGRGKVGLLSAGLYDLGITPAWAGKRKQVSPNRNRVEDHPRVGGEKQIFTYARIGSPGSPPRGRGKD